MKVTVPLVASSVAVVQAGDAASNFANVRRRLSYEKIAGYKPGSQVTDHCAIDLDQKALESQLALKTPEGFESAQRIYKEGGNSKSYAQVFLSAPLGTDIKKGDSIMGRNSEGNEVSGTAYQDYGANDQTIKVQYYTTDLQATYVECQVGGMTPETTNMKGCLAEEGTLTIGGNEHSYTYKPATDNNNGRTMSGFSTGAGEKMRTNCKGCPYPDFEYFYNYYGTDDYADQWVNAAFDGTSTQFRNGNADFSRYSLDGKEQVIKKGTAYLSVFMYVIREFEDALDDCESRCINCNDGSVHAWDEGVCFYTGSIEGQDGLTDDGKLLHQLADKRCIDYKTCGVEGTDLSGTAKLNYDLFDLFAVGNYQLTSGNCPAARETKKQIANLMYIPMIQGAMRYAYKVDKLQGGEKEKAEGAVFAAAVLPRVHAANSNAASTIYENLRVAAPSTDFKKVKAAFESVYADLGITCGDIGGLWNSATKEYYAGMEPCVQTVASMSTASESSGNNTLAIALGCTFGGLFAIAAALVLYMRSKEKQGEPVFKATGEDVKDMN
jgi:hypothetical protein